MDPFERELTTVLKKATKLKEIKLEVPPDPKLGNFAFPCFSLAKQEKKNPAEIAKQIGKKLKLSNKFSKIETHGPYINFYVNHSKAAAYTLKKVQKEGDGYGAQKKKNHAVMIEFFHANTHKGVHIGHIRNICLGETLSKLLEWSGHRVIRVNYQGDIGPHVAKCLWAVLNTDEAPPETNREEWLGNMYAKGNEAEKNEKLKKQIRTINKKLYKGDARIAKKWKETRQWCLNDFNKIYKEFNVKFDRFYFESEVEKRGVKIAGEFLKKGIAEKSQGALIIDLKKYDLGVYVLLTQDGHAVYHTKDLALAELKAKEYRVQESLHVVGKEQELYFKQLFKTFELAQSPMANKSKHIIYELVTLPEGKMSSREGNVIFYNDLIRKLEEAALLEVKKRHADWTDEEQAESAHSIAFGALKFSMVSKENNRILLFDWDRALDVEGSTGPYVQYAHTRIASIVRGTRIPKDANYSVLKEPEEMNLITLVGRFPEVVSEAASHYKPSFLAHYLIQLGQAFSTFYDRHTVLKADKKHKHARLHLISAVQQVLKNGLTLLGIDAPERM